MDTNLSVRKSRNNGKEQFHKEKTKIEAKSKVLRTAMITARIKNFPFLLLAL